MLTQLALIDCNFVNKQCISSKNVKATFFAVQEGQYDVVLEINSNKFYINFQNLFDITEKFEIIAVKGFVEVTQRIIAMLKSLVEHFFYRLG